MKSVLVKVITVLSLVLATASVSFAGEIEDSIVDKMKLINPNIEVSEVIESPWPGMYEVTLASGEVIFSDKSAEYLVLGQMFNLSLEKGFVNLTQKKFEKKVAAVLADANSDEQIIYKAKGEEKAVISVFTDISCYYCKKLHKAIPQLQESGVTIKYLAFPREGKNSDTANQMSSIWCAKDKAKAMNLAKNSGRIESLSCDDPVEKQFDLARELGVNATPTIFTTEGVKISGFASAERLLSEIGVLN